MPLVRFSPEFAQAFENVEELDVEVDAPTARECLHEASCKLGRNVEESIFERDHRTLAPDVKVEVGGERLSDADLDRGVGGDEEILVAPYKGNAGVMDNV